jgi:hypothetical protein
VAENEAIAMHATLKKYSVTDSAKGPVYKLAFEIPIAFIDILKELIGNQSVDMYWNGDQIGQSVSIGGVTGKEDKKNGGSTWSVPFNMDPGDIAFGELVRETRSLASAVGTVGDLRLDPLQLPLPTNV